jgi:ferritin
VQDQGTASAVGVLPTLEQMRQRGVLTNEEWQKAKDLLLKRPEMEQTVTQKIADMYQLRLSGALSESEFNMKKWDLLSAKS